ncbi:K02A2.6-like [Cordylochernes scorpioides]|uniref:K02A2.6-like n=1 Tax=Cordylochernes scorpioides TaxID=51811 RepID=A0ABY6KLR6_9ARAC|nr:K02A2.6-like [Cordylochernes scorpioides]
MTWASTVETDWLSLSCPPFIGVTSSSLFLILSCRIQPPETFDFSTPNEWPKWRKRFERYLVVSGMKKKEEADKIDLFMYLMGDRADDIFRTFKFEKEEEATKIDSVLKAFDSHFCVRKNIIYERAKFNSRIQEDREPVDEFITSLYKLADSCEFEGLHEQLIRDRIVVEVRDKALSERMQLDSELTLEKAVKLVRQQEAVRQQQVDLQRPSTSQKVNQVKFNSKKQSPKQQQQPSRKKEKSAKTRSRCPKCGGFTYREGQACRAEGQRSVEDSSNLDDEGECRRRWTAEIQVNGKQVKFKLDSQADVTCVPLCLFKKIMGQQRLVESDINIRAAEFSELQTVFMFISTLRNGNYEIKEKIYVIRRLSEPLLSRRACELLNLARRIEVVATRINPIKEFPEVFEGLGQIGNPYEIKLKPGAKPYTVHTPRRVPIPLMEKLKTRLEELEKAGIIAQVNVATEWCAPTVIAGKPNGDIRLCVDLSRLNEHVQREVHPMPVVDHMLGQLGEARFFSKLDANSGFHQISLSPDCQHLTTFITPFGRYKYCRMPFGISLAPEYFQKVMSLILQGMDGVMCYLDDILIFASDSKTHDRIFRLVLRKLKEAKVTLNKAKCVFGVSRINFLGHILDEDGIRPDPAKIEAVAKMPAPTDVHGVRRFLGMVNHLGHFVENLSEIVAPLNQLLVKGQDFVWDCSQERAFRKLKELLTTQPILAAYDVRKPTMVSSDASSYGLGAVLKQEGKNGIWRPVAYSSRTMTPTEKRYAQIEKEALAITCACERFQDFLLGKRFRIETDHKPLISLFSTKELSSLTPRLQRFRMRMMRFGFEIVHIPGKELLDADALSRQPLLTTEGGENERPTSAHINAVLSSITDKDEMLTKIFEAQQEDTTLKAVVNYLEQGWPDKKKMSQALLSYWHVKDELGVQNGLLMRSCRLVIPASMKLEILDELHAGHFGITKTRLRARETLDRLTANVVARSFKSIFARHGIPETVVSDNGTQFGAAREFANFARQYGFTHVTSSPRFPQSNGMAEAGVKIAKLILKKNQDPSLGLLEYRSTPLENGYSPAELLMGRKLRTTLPVAPENLNPRLVDSQTLKRKEGRRRKDMKSRYDRRCGATDMEELSEGLDLEERKQLRPARFRPPGGHQAFLKGKQETLIKQLCPGQQALQGLKVRELRQFLPRICLFNVEAETADEEIVKAFHSTDALSQLPGDKSVRVAHRSPTRNGTCTAFIVDQVILNYEESVRLRVCYRCCGYGHNADRKALGAEVGTFGGALVSNGLAGAAFMAVLTAVEALRSSGALGRVVAEATTAEADAGADGLLEVEDYSINHDSPANAQGSKGLEVHLDEGGAGPASGCRTVRHAHHLVPRKVSSIVELDVSSSTLKRQIRGRISFCWRTFIPFNLLAREIVTSGMVSDYWSGGPAFPWFVGRPKRLGGECGQRGQLLASPLGQPVGHQR